MARVKPGSGNFEEASRKAPSIIFIDEIDALAPKRAEVLGDVRKEGRGTTPCPHGWYGFSGDVIVIWVQPTFRN